MKSVLESILDKQMNELSKEIFDGNKLREDFRGFILKNLEKLLKGYKYYRVFLVGSMVSYNYKDDSDIDIHFSVMGMDKEEINDMIEEFGNLYWGKHRVEFYFEDDKELDNELKKGGVVDVVNNKFLSEPEKYNIDDIDIFYIMQVADIFISAFERRVNEFIYDVNEYLFLVNKLKNIDMESDEYRKINMRLDFLENEIKTDVDCIKIVWRLIKKFRNEGFEEDNDLELSVEVKFGNRSINNLVYKIIEKLNIKDLILKYKKYNIEEIFNKRLEVKNEK